MRAVRDAATALLLRRRPDRRCHAGRAAATRGRDPGEAAVRLVCALRGSYLPIQGPPGTGKTFTAAEQILALIAQGRTVGITGPSHAVIHNLIDKVCAHADARGARSAHRPAGRRGQPVSASSATR